MSDEQVAEQTDGNAPADDGGAPADDGDQVIMTRAQVDELFKNARNSAAAEMRRNGEFKKQQPTDDPRVKRGLELLQRYERVQHAEQDRQVEIEARLDAQRPFEARVMSALSNSRIKPQQAARPAAQSTTQPTSEIGQLLELMKADIASRMADKLPKAPVAFATPGDQIRTEMSAAVADIQADATLDEGQRHAKIQQTVMARLKSVKVTPGANNPNSVLRPKKG